MKKDHMLPRANHQWSKEEAAHLLNRAGFGGTPSEIDAFHQRGREAAVEWLLRAEEKAGWMPLPSWANPETIRQEARERLIAMREQRMESRERSPEAAERQRREVRKKFQQIERRRGMEMQQWWLNRMIQTNAPLREKMALFWHDHFATSMQKVRQPYLLLRQNVSFREQALGNFKKLTHRLARDAALMLYLDLPGSKKGKPNENFAREIMELFTLGPGNYSEQDIREAARAFTGYELNRLTGDVSHRKRQWDESPKTFLGKTASFDGDGIIDRIFEQKATAHFMAKKLWEYFAYENPPETAVELLAETLRKSEYELKPVLREILLSREFYSPHCMANQIKCPVVFYVQLLKQLEMPADSAAYSLQVQTQLGQILFAPPNVAGWDWGKAWINTNTLLTRYRIAGDLSQGGGNAGKMRGMQSTRAKKAGRAAMVNKTSSGPNYERIVPREKRADLAAVIESLSWRFFQRPLPSQVSDRFMAYANDKKGVVFTNQEVAELVHLMLSTPHYQLT